MAKKISTPREKALKKNILAGLISGIIGIIAAPVSLILIQMSNEQDSQAFAFVGLALIVVAVTGIVSGGMFLFYESKRIKRSYCENCGEKLDYESDVSWEVVDEVITSTQETATKKARVEFETKCHNCGHEKTFSQKFTTGHVNKEGKVTHTNLNKACRNYFSK